MGTLCICCNQLPMMGLRDLKEALFEFEQAIEEARNKLPESTILSLVDVYKMRSQATTRLCQSCWFAGCDGTSPCRIPAAFWVAKQPPLDTGSTEPILTASKTAELDSLDPAQQRNSPSAWSQISANEWLKEIKVPHGTLVCEVFGFPYSSGYLARVTVRTENSSSAEGTDDREMLETSEPLPLVEAQLECETLAAIVSKRPLSWTYSIPLGS